MREEALRWTEQAKAEQQAAKRALEIDICYLAAFLAHQSVEKLLKGMTIERLRIMPAHTHDLLRLAGALQAPPHIQACLRKLNPHYSVSRYPDAANGIPAQQYDHAITEPLLVAMDEVFEWLISE